MFTGRQITPLLTHLTRAATPRASAFSKSFATARPIPATLSSVKEDPTYRELFLTQPSLPSINEPADVQLAMAFVWTHLNAFLDRDFKWSEPRSELLQRALETSTDALDEMRKKPSAYIKDLKQMNNLLEQLIIASPEALSTKFSQLQNAVTKLQAESDESLTLAG